MVHGRLLPAAIVAVGVFAGVFYFMAHRSAGYQVLAEHAIEFYHAADKDQLLQRETLYELKLAEQEDPALPAARYYMDADSVFCGEGVCRIDTVRLFWTELGFYHSYHLDKNTRLEKFDGIDFEPVDYRKLDGLLGKRDSSLATLHPSELVRTPRGGNSVDALTGATVFIPKDDYVEGAIWTSYTLWHYLHGEIHTTVRNLSGDRLTEAELLEYAHTDSTDFQAFALQQLARRQPVSAEAFDRVCGISKRPFETLVSPLVNFAESLGGERYFRAISHYLGSDSSGLVVAALGSLPDAPESPPTWFLDDFAAGLGRFAEYRQTRLALEFLEQQGRLGQLEPAQVETLLEKENFVIARDAYWTLSRNAVDGDVQRLLDDFYRKNQHRL